MVFVSLDKVVLELIGKVLRKVINVPFMVVWYLPCNFSYFCIQMNRQTKFIMLKHAKNVIYDSNYHSSKYTLASAVYEMEGYTVA